MTNTENTIYARMSCKVIDAYTITVPDAKRGDFSPTLAKETLEQLNKDLVWDECPFCGGYVLVLTQCPIGSHYRERCQCGAKRVFRWGRLRDYDRYENKEPEEGWSKDGEGWVNI